MTVAVGLTAYWLWQALDFTVNNKTVANIDTMQFPIGQVHFPAVTACSFNLVSRRAALRLLGNWTFPRNISKDQVFEEMRLLPIAMFRGRSAFLAPNALKTTLFLNKVSIETLMKELAVPCDELIVRCAWQDKTQDCRKMFRMVKTFEGYCCAFNYIGDHNSSFEETENGPHPLEKSVATTGSDDGLVILVRTDKNDYHATMFSSYGTKLLISRPRSYISETARLVVVAPSTLIMVSYTPALTTTSAEVKALDTSLRDCVIENEVSLAYFKLYTYHNCLEECKINITERYCGCVLTTYYTTNMDRVCDLNDLPCLASHQALINSYMLSDEFTHVDVQQLRTKWPTPCALINSYMLSDEFTHVDVQQLRTKWPTPCGCKPRCYYTQYSLQ
ncbi:sodium channel protein Nach-like [Macrosteles quadrilineatus]|uniref:sodium channel protein Nach-like n=1 Tax=Macrosteles quadrilineatus TaxID=74068 RepID=UPI0023E32A5B|nr:sodium channel protein Nach-like [Macrosteles quadrilineatus]